MSDYPASLDVRPLTTWPGVLTAAHPDRNGGSQEQWDRVEEAAKVLGVL